MRRQTEKSGSVAVFGHIHGMVLTRTQINPGHSYPCIHDKF